MSLIGSSDAQIGKILDTIDDVARIIGTDSGISVPQIAVIGDQSTGKSSLIESMVGRELPKGSKLTTRCATRLQLRKSEEESFRIEYGGQAKREIADGDSIADEIRQATNQLIQSKQSEEDNLIVDEEIVLTVEGPQLYNITLLDLPGFRVDDMGVVVKQLVNRIIRQPNTLIVVCMTADSDPEREQALNIAKAANPDCSRILIVLTKSDQSDYGIEEKFQTLSRQYPQGVTMVLCRTQQQLQDGLTLEDMRREEQRFFNNPGQKDKKCQNLNKIDHKFKGREALLEKLSRLQMEIIDLNDLKKTVQQQLQTFSQDLKNAQESLSAMKDPVLFLSTMIKEIVESYVALGTNTVGNFKGVDIGKFSKKGMIEEKLQISNYIAKQSELFAQKVASNVPNFFSKEGVEIIQSHQNNRCKAVSGTRNSVQSFTNTFDALVLEEEGVLKLPLMQMSSDVFDQAKYIFEKMTEICIQKRGLSQNLKLEMNIVSNKVFLSLKDGTDDFLQQAIEMQTQTLGLGEYERKVKGTYLDRCYPTEEATDRASNRAFLTFYRVFESMLDLTCTQSDFAVMDVDKLSKGIGHLMVLLLKSFALEDIFQFGDDKSGSDITQTMKAAQQAFKSCSTPDTAKNQSVQTQTEAAEILRIVQNIVSQRVTEVNQIMAKILELLPAIFDEEIEQLENSHQPIRDTTSLELFQLQCMLTIYLDVALKWFVCTVPMYLRHKVVDQAQEKLYNELIGQLKNVPETEDFEPENYQKPPPKQKTDKDLVHLLGSNKFANLQRVKDNFESVKQAKNLLDNIGQIQNDYYAN
eukprot:TRINITY_DN11766_c0_g1_i1.p1 TRINITY_DN11766_c0_g1~~TRINITY_DN11766_c0_g1_i1.p1  ORF type:complete len:806 (+),score=150.48 TRINITY_DN11766_c0_g1_i1:124-2541(+)